MAKDRYDDDFDDLEDDNYDDSDFEEETPHQRKKRERAEAKARKKQQAKARKRKKHAEISDYEDDDGYEDDLNDQAEEMADDSLDDEPEDDYDEDQPAPSSGSFKDLLDGKGNTKVLILKYIVPPVVGIVVGLIGGAILVGGSSNNNQQVAQPSQKGVKPIESIQHAYSLTDVINSISHAQVNTLQRQLSQLSANGDDNGYSDDQFEQAKQAVSGINGMTNDVINPFFDKVLTMPVTESHKDQKSTALDDAVSNASSSSSSQSSQSSKPQQNSSQAKGSSQKASSSSSSNNTQPSKADSSSADDGTNPVSRSVAQDKAAQIFSQENDKISKDKNERTQIAGEILASGPANDLQQAGLKSGNAMAFEAGADKKTFTYVVAVPYSTKTKTVNAIFTMKIGADKRIKSYHYVGYLNKINDQAKNFYNDLH